MTILYRNRATSAHIWPTFRWSNRRAAGIHVRSYRDIGLRLRTVDVELGVSGINKAPFFIPLPPSRTQICLEESRQGRPRSFYATMAREKGRKRGERKKIKFKVEKRPQKSSLSLRSKSSAWTPRKNLAYLGRATVAEGGDARTDLKWSNTLQCTCSSNAAR